LDRLRGLVVPESGTVDDRNSKMTLAQSVAEILRDHVTLEVEGIDRMFLNAVVPPIGEHGFHAFQRRRVVGDQRASALRFGNERVQA
jgi:hypothetical protein